jgi:hypothetical protein
MYQQGVNMKVTLILLLITNTAIASGGNPSDSQSNDYSKVEQNLNLECIGKICTPRPGAAVNSESNELQKNDMVVGRCYIDIKTSIYKKLMAIQSKRYTELVFLTEKDDGQNMLVSEVVDYESRNFNRNMKIIDCASTPNLAKTKYVNDCTKDRRYSSYARKMYCEVERKRSW